MDKNREAILQARQRRMEQVNKAFSDTKTDDSIEKAVYVDNVENRRLNRVGQTWGGEKTEEGHDKGAHAKAQSDYKSYKQRAMSRYHDPIDFPQEVKQKLSHLSSKVVETKPAETKGQILKKMKREDVVRNKKFDNNKDIEKVINKKLPNYKIASELHSLSSAHNMKYLNDEGRKTAREDYEVIFEMSPFKTRTEASQAYIEGNKLRKDIKKKQGSIQSLQKQLDKVESKMGKKGANKRELTREKKELVSYIKDHEKDLTELGF